jgi:uncharacterized NAD(P)/FAD-binding protein YdhS
VLPQLSTTIETKSNQNALKAATDEFIRNEFSSLIRQVAIEIESNKCDWPSTTDGAMATGEEWENKI